MPSKRRPQFAGALGAALIWFSGFAAADEQVAVTREGSTYNVRMSIELDAPASRVRALLTDYAHLNRINPTVIRSAVLPAPAPGVTRVHTYLKGCLWFFCRRLNLVEDLRIDGGGDIRAQIVAELSDMKSGTTRWTIEDGGPVSRVSYAATMEPKFWIPPLIGPKAIIRNLRDNLKVTAENLKRLSRPADGGSIRGSER